MTPSRYALLFQPKKVGQKSENEKQNRMYFLDVEIIPDDKALATFMYHKPTFSGVYTHFDSFLPSNYKFGLFTHSLIDAFEYVQVRLNYTLN